MCVRVRVRERRRRLGFCGDYLEGSGPFEDLSAAITQVDAFKFGPLTPTDVAVRVTIRRGLREAFILRATAPRRARAGSSIGVRLLLRRRRGGVFRRTVRVRVPRSLRAGVRTLTLRGVVPKSLSEGAEEGLELVLEEEGGTGGAGGGDEAGARSLDELAAAIRALGGSDGLRATFSSEGRGRVVKPARSELIRGKVQIPVRIVPRR